MLTSNKLKLFFQYYTPQKTLTQLMGWLANSKIKLIKNSFIKIFCYFYKIDMTEAVEQNPLNYPTFHDFFIRRLKPNARIINSEKNSITSPADGVISQMGQITHGKLIQAKGKDYKLEALLVNNQELVEKFQDGFFQTIYLAPHNYHRVHMPVSGILRKMIYVPGKLYSVSLFTAENIPDLFAKNERVICLFDTEFGPMAVILVGAMIVGSINTVWAGNITPGDHARKNKVFSIDYADNNNHPENAIKLEKGAELGYFSLGSTVITLFAKESIHWDETISENQSIQMGEKIANGTAI